MALAVGAVLTLLVGLFATGTGLDRDRGFYPVVTVVIAATYVLFAVLGDSTHALFLDLLACIVFVAVAVTGFKRSLWVVVIALAGHGMLDLTHAAVISNPGVPPWWPEFCFAYDVSAAGYLAWLIRSGRVRASA
jgi:hypothetical protein